MNYYFEHKTILDKIPYSKIFKMMEEAKKVALLDLGMSKHMRAYSYIIDIINMSEIKKYSKYYKSTKTLVVQNYTSGEFITWFENNIDSPVFVLFRNCDFNNLRFFGCFDKTKYFTFENCEIDTSFMYRFMPWVPFITFKNCNFKLDFESWVAGLNKVIKLDNIVIFDCQFGCETKTFRIKRNEYHHFIVYN